jgi:predicted transcriptional regulator
METIAVSFREDAADRLKRAAAEIGMPIGEFIASAAEGFVMDKDVHRGAPLSAEQIAQIEAGLAAEQKGRIVSNEEANARLAARRVR